MIIYLTVMLLIALGLYAVLFKKNLIKIVIGVSLIESGLNLFLISLGFVNDGQAPIYTLAHAGKTMALPTPQALTLTAIVISLATTALMLSFVVMIYKNYGTLDSRKLGGLLNE